MQCSLVGGTGHLPYQRVARRKSPGALAAALLLLRSLNSSQHNKPSHPPHLVAEVHVAGGVNQVERVRLPILGHVLWQGTSAKGGCGR